MVHYTNINQYYFPKKIPATGFSKRREGHFPKTYLITDETLEVRTF
jgi:hypothetical protein